MIYSVQFIGGVLLLYCGAELLINSSKLLSHTLGIPKIIVGITIIAFGTSLPELFVSIIAMIKNESEIVLGNVIGSNITNIGLVLGIAAMIKSISIDFRKVKNDIFFMLLSTIFIVIAIYFNVLNYVSALILICSFLVYIYFINIEDNNLDIVVSNNLIKPIGLILLGICSLAYGSNLFISGASGIAIILGVNKIVIGMTIVALGTSIPEFATSIISMKKGEYDFVIGNIIGSNIFNIILVLAVSLFINNINVSFSSIKLQLFLLIIISSLLSYVIFKFNKVTKLSGVIFFLVYIFFILMNYGK